MTECNRKSLTFCSLGTQKIVADFDGGRLTTDAGALLLRQVDRQLGLTQALADSIADAHDPARITHERRTLLAQRIFGLALGYEDLNDHEALRHDPLFAILAEQRPAPEAPLGSPSTLCRFENAVTRDSLVRMSEVLVDQFIGSFKRPHWALVPEGGGDPVTPQEVYEGKVRPQLPRWQAWAREAKAKLDASRERLAAQRAAESLTFRRREIPSICEARQNGTSGNPPAGRRARSRLVGTAGASRNLSVNRLPPTSRVSRRCRMPLFALFG